MKLLYSINPYYINKVDTTSDIYRNNFNQWINVETSIDEFIEVVTQDGFAINAQLDPSTQRAREVDFLQTNLLLLDIDDYATLEDALNTALYERYGAGYYTSQNNTAEHNKYRLIFVMDTIITDSTYLRMIRQAMNWLYKADEVTANPTRVMFGNNTSTKDFDYCTKVLPLAVIDDIILAYDDVHPVYVPQKSEYTPTDNDVLPTKIDEMHYVLQQLGQLDYMAWRDTAWRAIEFLGVEGINIMKSYYPEQNSNEYNVLYKSWNKTKTPHWNGIYKTHNIDWHKGQDYVLTRSKDRQLKLKGK